MVGPASMHYAEHQKPRFRGVFGWPYLFYFPGGMGLVGGML